MFPCLIYLYFNIIFIANPNSYLRYLALDSDPNPFNNPIICINEIILIYFK